MTSFHGLKLAIEQAEHLRDDRAKAVARLAGQMGMLQNQMTQLQSYAQDTEKRWINSALQQISGEMVRHHYQFMGRLQHAIDLQSNVIASALREVEIARKDLLEAEVRLSGLRNVLKSRLIQQNKEVMRQEQRQMDEFAALAHARLTAKSHVGECHDH